MKKNENEKISCSGTDHQCRQAESHQDCRHAKNDQEAEDKRRLQERLSRIGQTIVVLSGKGGVGKSTVAVNLAVSLLQAGKKVGLLDVDIHGPSIPTMLGLEKEEIQSGPEGLFPVNRGGLKVMSLGFLLRHQDDAVIWRGPLKMGLIKQFLQDVVWGDLDYLVIDSPPGTGDEPLSVCQLIAGRVAALLVTTPQKVAAVDVRKSITFCRQLQVPVLGVIENMNGFACPKCGEITPILASGGGRVMAEEMGVPFLGSLPIDLRVADLADQGRVLIEDYSENPTAVIMSSIMASLVDSAFPEVSGQNQTVSDSPDGLLLAVPLAEGKLTAHFGHCERFALVRADRASGQVKLEKEIEAPPHEPGKLPAWLAERGVNLIIAGGMGQRAQDLFKERGIEVVVGAPVDTAENLAASYLAGTLPSGANLCDH